jgi:carboxylesterase
VTASAEHHERRGAFSATSGPNGVLLLHGFTGSPASMRPLAEAFANAGFSVEVPVLPGHGSTVAELSEARFEHWAQAAEAEYLALEAKSERVLVAGLSMGGLLGCLLAQEHAALAGLILINPYIEPPSASFIALLEQALASGALSVPSIGSDIARPGVVSGGYDETPIAPLLSLSSAVGEVASRLSEVTCPTLLFSSRIDHVVPPSSGDFLEAKVAGPLERVYLEHSYHVATLDEDAAELEARAVAFAQKLTVR